ncbi:MAG TPA: flagellar biosynthetic protein FliO [Bryobacteraceae bacterium]|nr:flagellar biosynthetic protein FliO [Bryobacteraceae bacterium]
MEPLQQAAAVLLVLVLLGATVYALRAKGMVMMLRRTSGSANQRQLEAVDRLPLTPHHSLHLVRVEGRTVLIAVSPGGCAIVDHEIENPFADRPLSRGGTAR